MNALLNALLYWFSGRLRCRLIKVKGEPYLERYFLGTLFGRHVYLHRFLTSDDPSVGVHDHPWLWSMSFLICGWYHEVRRWGKLKKRWVNFIGPDHFHLVELEPCVYTWSIFMTGQPKPGRVWGMLHRVDPKAIMFEDERQVEWVFIPYDYGVAGHNENAVALKWWETYDRGNQVQRERRDYVRAV